MFAINRRASFDYTIMDTFTAGLVLHGSEVKSIRLGRANIAEAYVGFEDGNIVLINASIEHYKFSHNTSQHEIRRKRTLLMRKREISRLQNQLKKGMTIIPLNLFQSEKGLIKIKIALAVGKKNHDKREATKERDWKRDKARLLKGDQ
jgi:SsrA-binding protein